MPQEKFERQVLPCPLWWIASPIPPYNWPQTAILSIAVNFYAVAIPLSIQFKRPDTKGLLIDFHMLFLLHIGFYDEIPWSDPRSNWPINSTRGARSLSYTIENSWWKWSSLPSTSWWSPSNNPIEALYTGKCRRWSANTRHRLMALLSSMIASWIMLSTHDRVCGHFSAIRIDAPWWSGVYWTQTGFSPS